MNLSMLDHALESAFAWAWKTSLQGSVLIALVLLVRLIFGKVLAPRWRYALGLLVLLRLLLPGTPPSSFSIFNLGNQRSSLRPVQLATLPATSPQPTVPVVIAAAPAVRATTMQTGAISGHFVLPCLWLTGFAALLTLAVCQQRNFVRKLGRWEPVREPRVIELLEQCRTVLGVKRNVIVLAATGLNTPALFGIIQPRLLIPSEMLRRLDDRELRHIFLHELIHLKRGDLLVNWAVIIVRAAHWFNPAVWLALKNLRADQELACDAAVLSLLAADERRHYGRTLLNLLDGFSTASLCPAVVPFITGKQIIKRRITMISNFKPAGRFAAPASLALLISLGAFTFTRAAEPLDTTLTSPDAPLVVTVGKDGTFQVGTNTQSVGIERLKKVLEAEAAKNPNLPLSIRTDNQTAFKDLEKLLQAAEERQIRSITLDNGATSSGRIDSLKSVQEQEEQTLRLEEAIKNHESGFSPTNYPEQQLRELDNSILMMEIKLRNLRDQLVIHTNENSMDASQIISRLNSSIADAESQRVQHEALLNQLQQLNREQLRQTLPTTIPDAMLTQLMEDELGAEQKFVTQKSSMGDNNPEVLTTKALIDKLDKQLNDRVLGILNGLKLQIDSENDSIAALKQEINQRRHDNLQEKERLQAENSDLSLEISQMEKALGELVAKRGELSASLKDGQTK